MSPTSSSSHSSGSSSMMSSKSSSPVSLSVKLYFTPRLMAPSVSGRSTTIDQSSSSKSSSKSSKSSKSSSPSSISPISSGSETSAGASLDTAGADEFTFLSSLFLRQDTIESIIASARARADSFNTTFFICITPHSPL